MNFVQTELQNIILNNESDENYILNKIKLIIYEGVKKYVPIIKTMSNNKNFINTR